MGFFYKILRWYDRVQLACWIGSTLTAFAAPLLGYAIYLMPFVKKNRDLAADDPELVSERPVPDPLTFLTSGDYGLLALLLRLVMVFGFILIILCLVLRICKLILGTRGKTSSKGVSKTDEKTTEDEENEPRTDTDNIVPDDLYEEDDEELDDYGAEE